MVSAPGSPPEEKVYRASRLRLLALAAGVGAVGAGFLWAWLLSWDPAYLVLGGGFGIWSLWAAASAVTGRSRIRLHADGLEVTRLFSSCQVPWRRVSQLQVRPTGAFGNAFVVVEVTGEISSGVGMPWLYGVTAEDLVAEASALRKRALANAAPAPPPTLPSWQNWRSKGSGRICGTGYSSP